MNNNILNKIEPAECSCNQCKLMCYVSPCFPTPQDVDNIIRAGFEQNLKPTAYINLDTLQRYDLIAPDSKQIITIDKNGNNVVLNKCVFLDDSNLCKLHKLGLKPIEGKLTLHNRKESEAVELRVSVCETWTNNENSELVTKITDYLD